jgi:large subunit ribosomal protein L21
MEYAVVKIQGKQYKVSEGDILEVGGIEAKTKEMISFPEVLLVVSAREVLVGRPNVERAKVVGVILEHFRGPKIRVAKYKAKSRYRRVVGHRQELSRIKITEIRVSSRRKTKDI